MFPAHAVFDALAYFVGARLYFVARRRGDVIESPTRWSVITAAILGAAIGSRLLFLLEDPAATWAHRTDPLFLMGGKTVVGALAMYPGLSPFSGGGYGGNSSVCVCRVSRFGLDRYARMVFANSSRMI